MADLWEWELTDETPPEHIQAQLKAQADKARGEIWDSLSDAEKRLQILEEAVEMWSGWLEEDRLAGEWKTNKHVRDNMKKLQARVRKCQTRIKQLKRQIKSEQSTEPSR